MTRLNFNTSKKRLESPIRAISKFQGRPPRVFSAFYQRFLPSVTVERDDEVSDDRECTRVCIAALPTDANNITQICANKPHPTAARFA